MKLKIKDRELRNNLKELIYFNVDSRNTVKPNRLMQPQTIGTFEHLI